MLLEQASKACAVVQNVMLADGMFWLERCMKNLVIDDGCELFSSGWWGRREEVGGSAVGLGIREEKALIVQGLYGYISNYCTAAQYYLN